MTRTQEAAKSPEKTAINLHSWFDLGLARHLVVSEFRNEGACPWIADTT